MAVAEPYRFRRSGRAPITVIALIVSLAAMALAWAAGAPWFAYLPMGIATAEALRQLIVNPVTGIDIGAAELVLHDRGRAEHVALAAIEHVTFHGWTDGVDITLALRDQRRIVLSSRLLPTSGLLRTELERRGLRVVTA